ncbi:MAG TPA: hypothetical protein VK501_12250 [Baekduia sp.]|nr:hypothetical protein [Baekduia sp.]
MHARPVLGALVAAALLLASGCGSSGGDDGAKPAAAAPKPAAAAPATPEVAAPTGPAPTKAAYVRRADRVCLEARGLSQRANEAVTKAFAAKQPTAAADAIDRYMPIFATHIETLKGLRRPKGDQKILAGLIKVMDSQVKALADESKALRDQDDALLQQIGAAQQQELSFAEELGKQYGFKVCGRAV